MVNTKAIAITIAFAALSIALVPFRILTLYWPGMYYYFWEIPIVAAFLLFGFKCGVSVAVLNGIARMVLIPGPLGFFMVPWGVVVTSSTLLGVYLAYRLFTRRASQEKTLLGRRPVVYFTGLGVLSRAVIMSFLDYAVLYRVLLPFVLGRSFSDAYIIALMPGIVFFNVIVPLYTVSVGYFVAKTVSRNLKVGNQL
jgi:riboflavin transporter FmnP